MIAAEADICPRCRWIDAGRIAYADGLRLQDEARVTVAAGACQGVRIMLEHDPVVTLGRAGGADNVRHDLIGCFGVPVVEAARGGNVTCHDPRQLVVYPVLDLAAWRKDVVWYVRTPAAFGVSAVRKGHYTGVEIGDEKVAAIGRFDAQMDLRPWAYLERRQ